VYPHTVEAQNFCYVDLQVTYKAEYPSVQPDLVLLKEGRKGVNDA